jgi:hypothetical protein
VNATLQIGSGSARASPSQCSARRPSSSQPDHGGEWQVKASGCRAALMRNCTEGLQSGRHRLTSAVHRMVRLLILGQHRCYEAAAWLRPYQQARVIRCSTSSGEVRQLHRCPPAHLHRLVRVLRCKDDEVVLLVAPMVATVIIIMTIRRRCHPCQLGSRQEHNRTGGQDVHCHGCIGACNCVTELFMDGLRSKMAAKRMPYTHGASRQH